MTDAQKLEIIATLLDDGGEVPSADKLTAYLNLAGKEILAWMYHLIGGVPDGMTVVPEKYDGTHIYSVVAGYTHGVQRAKSNTMRTVLTVCSCMRICSITSTTTYCRM